VYNECMRTKIANTKYCHGGLLRCCIATLDEEKDRELDIGDEITCHYCGSHMVRCSDGVIK
jgi:flagellar biosynthesis regulator FlaF